VSGPRAGPLPSDEGQTFLLRWRRAFVCRCGRPVFFRNSQCLACGAALGFDPHTRRLLALDAVGSDGVWRDATDDSAASPRWRRCAQALGAAGCNWLVRDDEAQGGSASCTCCRLLRTHADLSDAESAQWFFRVEVARRALCASLLGLHVPLQPQAQHARGLAFDLLCAPPGAPAVVTGHVDGVITIDLEEADDARRETRRHALGEPYRTLLGHLRHESGHYVWWRLIETDAEQLAGWRACFGDERADYAQALAQHHAHGAPADWALRHVSAYASCHPWEDWAETWAHYLHWSDALDTARSYGLDGSVVALEYEPLPLGEGVDAEFAALSRSWMQLSGVLNEMSRAMGVADFYPFVLSAPALRKLAFAHRLVGALDGMPIAEQPGDDPAATDR
jgi:hypothetical protein